MTAATKCALCDHPAEGFASIDDRRYCHGEQSPSCYERAQWTESVSPEEYAATHAEAIAWAHRVAREDQS